MNRSRYLVGIDLGTTNCAVAYVDTHGRDRPAAEIRDYPVPQLVAPGETAPRLMLPSFLYLPGEHELPPGATRLPWDEGVDRIVGAFARDDESLRLEHQEVVLTVPASFDEAARELTIEAARRARLATITLLEEPQAAFYCWIVSHKDRWQREVRAGELILVCDIGGGTTDFS